MKVTLEITRDSLLDSLGSIEPCGEHGVDTKRLTNLIDTIKIVDSLLFRIEKVAEHKDSHCESEQAIGKRAHEFMIELKQTIVDYDSK